MAHAFRANGEHQHLGRETVPAPVRWDKGAWPVVNGGGAIAGDMVGPSLPGPVRKQACAQADGFDGAGLGSSWNYLHNPVTAHYSLSARPGYLRLLGAPATLAKPDA